MEIISVENITATLSKYTSESIENDTLQEFFKYALSEINSSNSYAHTVFVVFNNILVLWYRLNNESDLEKSSTFVRDFSTFGNNGTVNGNATFVGDGTLLAFIHSVLLIFYRCRRQLKPKLAGIIYCRGMEKNNKIFRGN
jgi:hypothetical protein